MIGKALTSIVTLLMSVKTTCFLGHMPEHLFFFQYMTLVNTYSSEVQVLDSQFSGNKDHFTIFHDRSATISHTEGSAFASLKLLVLDFI